MWNVGGLAQLGEHLLCKQGVVGSIPSSSTKELQCRSAVAVCGGLRAARFTDIERPFPSVVVIAYESAGLQSVLDWVFRHLMEDLPCSLTIWKKHNESFWLSLSAGVSTGMLV